MSATKVKKTFKISGLHCASCAMLIEGELEDIGVAARCNYRKETVDVENDGTVSDWEIKEAIQKAGYSVVDD